MAQMADGKLAPSELVRGAVKFPEPERDFRRSSQSDMDQALLDLQDHKQQWVDLDISERIQILDEIMGALGSVADEWVARSLREKGVPAGTFSETEEWASFWPLPRGIRLLRQSLDDIRRGRPPQFPAQLKTRSDGTVVTPVLPASLYERILFMGISAEIWLQPGMSPQEVVARQASLYFDKQREGKVALVLGAGNVAFLPYGQTMEKLFGQLQVVILKLNPINAYLGPLLERAFAALIKRGFLRVVYGGAEEGSYLAYHPNVEAIQLTGSDKTFETIVFGSGAEGQERKANRDPLLEKPIDAELGNVSPVIVVPGPWTEADLDYQAKQLATWQVANAGYFCLTPRVIIQSEGWQHRADLRRRIGQVLTQLPTRPAYYPGSELTHARFLEAHPGAQTYGEPMPGELPWTLIPDVDPSQEDDIVFTTEGFCSVFAETGLQAQSVSDYLAKAVEFANDKLWGTLSATILIHPQSLKDPQVAAALDRAIADLRYGTICVNYFTGVAAACIVTPWGGYPNDDIYDVQSGNGVINNVFLLEGIQKSVFRAPFRRWPDPFLATAKRSYRFARKMARFDAAPSIWKFPGLLLSAMLS